MFKYIFIVGLLVSTQCQAKDITITLNDSEVQQLVSLIDTAVKAAGLNAAGSALQIIKKIQDAENIPDKVPTK